MKERKKEEKEQEQNRNFHFQYSTTVRRINESLGLSFTLEWLRVLMYKSFASLCCVYLGAAPIP